MLQNDLNSSYNALTEGKMSVIYNFFNLLVQLNLTYVPRLTIRITEYPKSDNSDFIQSDNKIY